MPSLFCSLAKFVSEASVFVSAIYMSTISNSVPAAVLNMILFA